MPTLKILSIAVASGRAGFVCLQGTQILDWGIAVKAVQTGSDLAGYVQQLIIDQEPDVVVTEKCGAGCRKGKRTKELIGSIAALASHNDVLDVSVVRPRTFPSKYEEAHYLVGKHPEVAGYVPKRKRRLFDFEPRGMVVFEAIALAEAVTNGPPEQLAAAMG